MTTELIIAIIGSAGFGAILTWFFGGRQSHKNSVDNDSHTREKEFFDIVDQRAQKEVSSEVDKIIRCAKKCSHSSNCPIINLWDE